MRAAGTDGPRAGNVPFRVPDDDHLVIQRLHAQLQLRPLAGDGRDLIAVLVIVAEASDRELLPQAVGAKLQFGSQPDVARQQADDGFRNHRPTRLEKRPHSGTPLSGMLRQHLGEEDEIGIEETGHVLLRFRKRVMPEELPDQRRIRPAVKAHVGRSAGKAKYRLGRPGEGLDSSAPGPDQRPIDVEQYDTHEPDPHPAGLQTIPQRP